MSESKIINGCTLRLVREDITDFEAEAIVFYARPNLDLGAGFGSAISRRGGPSVKAELDKLGPVGLTGAVITSGGGMKARYIVHAVGPVFQEEQIEAKLRATLVNALKLAEEKGIRQVAFPPMGAGFYGIPLATCSQVMIGTLREYLANGSSLEEVIICANDLREFRVFQGALGALP